MKKYLNIVVVLVAFFTYAQQGYAALTNTAPSKYKQNVTKYNQSTSKSTTKTTTQTISQAAKQKYYNDYVKYIEQTIMNLGCFNSTDTYNANITINLTFNSDYSVKDASVNTYELGVGREIINNGINRDAYRKKCNLCESKLFMTNFKPYDSRYADGQHSTKEFFIRLKNLELQKTISSYQLSKTLVDYNYWTPPSSGTQEYDPKRCIGGYCTGERSALQHCTVKVVLHFGDERFWLKSYNIIDSSGDNDYNAMVQVALKRWMNKVSGNISCYDYNHYMGDVTVYLSFDGNKISTHNSPPEKLIQNNQPTTQPITSQYQSPYYRMMNMGNSILP